MEKGFSVPVTFSFTRKRGETHKLSKRVLFDTTEKKKFKTVLCKDYFLNILLGGTWRVGRSGY